MTACEIGQQTTRGKEESRWQTTTAPGREHEKIKKLSLCKNTFFGNTVCPAEKKTAKTPHVMF
jgi:hypothetical protein